MKSVGKGSKYFENNGRIRTYHTVEFIAGILHSSTNRVCNYSSMRHTAHDSARDGIALLKAKRLCTYSCPLKRWRLAQRKKTERM